MVDVVALVQDAVSWLKKTLHAKMLTVVVRLPATDGDNIKYDTFVHDAEQGTRTDQAAQGGIAAVAATSPSLRPTAATPPLSPFSQQFKQSHSGCQILSRMAGDYSSTVHLSKNAIWSEHAVISKV